MYASDWPHWDGDYPRSLFEIQQREDLTEEQRQAERFYGLR
jgi:predicted TIM-barrel fold metal-dependent hydrolase